VYCRPSDVGHDVLFMGAGCDLDDLTARSSDLAGGDVTAVAGRLPGEAGTLQPETLGRRARGRKATDAVLENGSGCSGLDRSERGKHEHIRVPEHVSGVGIASQSPRTDSGLFGLGCRGEE